MNPRSRELAAGATARTLGLGQRTNLHSNLTPYFASWARGDSDKSLSFSVCGDSKPISSSCCDNSVNTRTLRFAIKYVLSEGQLTVPLCGIGTRKQRMEARDAWGLDQQIGGSKDKGRLCGDQELRMGRRGVAFSETRTLEDRQVCTVC